MLKEGGVEQPQESDCSTHEKTKFAFADITDLLRG
jgi:hypothetical protein